MGRAGESNTAEIGKGDSSLLLLTDTHSGAVKIDEAWPDLNFTLHTTTVEVDCDLRALSNSLTQFWPEFFELVFLTTPIIQPLRAFFQAAIIFVFRVGS